MYLVNDLDAFNLANAYASFWKMVTWYRMYCAANFGKNKSDYKEGLASLKDAFFELSEDDNVSRYIKEPATTLIKSIESRLERKRFTGEDVKYIADLLSAFENQREEFTNKYLDAYLRQSAASELPKGMSTILPLLENDENNESIVESFKYLDRLLQKSLGVSPHDYYGESLVNLAFSPGDGKLKLGTHDNEQRGLRNLVSGLYALFRNPAAHRDIFDRTTGILRFDGAEQTAATVTVMVGLLAKLTYETFYNSLDSLIREKLTRIAKKYNWNEDITQFAWKFRYSWGIGLLPEFRHLSDCQLVVTLADDNQGPHLEIIVRAELEDGDIEELTQHFHHILKLRTLIRKL